jgi:hypothetical protein
VTQHALLEGLLSLRGVLRCRNAGQMEAQADCKNSGGDKPISNFLLPLGWLMTRSC